MDDNRDQGRSVFGGIGPTSGTDFFYSLVEHLARSVDADCAWLAESIPGSKAKIRTLAVSIEGRYAENFEYSIADTPAQNMFDDAGIYLISGGVRERFPEDRILRDSNAGGYAGIPVVDAAGNVLGLLAVASCGPLANARLLASQLRICANRAAAELGKRRTESALKASEARLKLMFDHAPDAYLLLTFDGKLLEANRAAERLTGLTRADMIGRNVLIPGIMPEADIRRAAARLQVRAAGAPASQEEFTILQRNGGKVFAETYSEIVTIDGEKVMLLCIRDITGRKMAQQGRQNQIDRTHQLLNAALTFATHEVLAAGTEEQIARYATRTACGLTGAVAVSIWLFCGDGDEIRCLDRFEASSGIHSGGETFISGKSRYRAEWQESHAVRIDDVSLEAGIRAGGNVGGVLRIERAAAEARTWEPEEVKFIETVSSLLGRSLLHADRANAAETPIKAERCLDHLNDERFRGTETILLVEDQEEVRTLARTMLESLGYRVLSASNADTALRIEREHRATIDLMLTDVVMPGMHGDELADSLSRRRPSLKVLFMSGYTTHTAVQKNDARRGRGFIRKPFDPFVLAGSIRDLLG